MAKQSQKKFDDTRDTILRTATTLFSKKGIMGTSFSDIAKEVKLSKGTISYYFPSKEHLVFEVNEFNLSLITGIIFKWIDQLIAGESPQQAAMQLVDLLSESGESMSLELCMMFESMKDIFGLKKRVVEKLAEWQTMIKIGLMKIGLSGRGLDREVAMLCLLMESMIVRTSLGLMPHSIDFLYDGSAE